MVEAGLLPAVLLPVVFVDGDQSVDLGTVTVQPSLGVKKLQAVVADRVGLPPAQISASLAGRRRVPLDDATDLAAAVAREGAGCYVLAGLRRSRRDRRGGRSRRDKKSAVADNNSNNNNKTILKRRLPPTDLASLAAAAAPPPPQALMGGAGWGDYEARLRDLQRQRDWYLLNTQQTPQPYYEFDLDFNPPPPHHHMEEMEAMEDLWMGSGRSSPRCRECEAAAAARRQPAFHWCVRDAVTVGFRSPVGPIQRPAKKTPSLVGGMASVY